MASEALKQQRDIGIRYGAHHIGRIEAERSVSVLVLVVLLVKDIRVDSLVLGLLCIGYHIRQRTVGVVESLTRRLDGSSKLRAPHQYFLRRRSLGTRVAEGVCHAFTSVVLFLSLGEYITVGLR